jgi:glucose/arabinose dehydrogenase
MIYTKTKITSFLIFIFSLINVGFSLSFKDGFVGKKIIVGLNRPSAIDIAPDGRIFIAEKGGTVRIVENNQLLPNPILDLEVDEYGERGLGGIVLHPNFDQNGYLYLYYSVQNQNHNQVVRYKMNGNTIIPGSDTLIFSFNPLSEQFHNGGAMHFGKDGYLYIAVGDGGQPLNGQNSNTLLGKMIRIKDDGSIPTDNPFYSQLTGKNRAIYAYGFRNPYTFDVDPLSGKIFVNDVGDTNWEEINEVFYGKNYGWATIEGKIKQNETAPEHYQDPYYVYDHNAGCAIIGAGFYNPATTNWPQKYQNNYLFSDFCTGHLALIDLNTGLVHDTIIKNAINPTGFKIGNNGKLFMLNFYSGELWEIDYLGDGKPFITNQPQNVQIAKNEEANFEIEVLGNTTFNYTWFLNGNALSNSNSKNISLIDSELSLNSSLVYYRINNQTDTIFSDTVSISVVDNQRPSLNFILPNLNQKYSGGDTIYFNGNATDLEDGNLNSTNYSWKIDFQHDEHLHPVLNWTSDMSQGYFVVPRVGELDTNVSYNFTFKAIDNQGFETIETRKIKPDISTLKIESSLSNIKILLDGTLVQLPYEGRGVTGLSRSLSSDLYISHNDSLLKFNSWNNDTNRISFCKLPANDTIINVNYDFVADWYEGNGQGLRGSYYSSLKIDTTPKYQKIDPVIDFLWGWQSPDALPGDYFSVVWEGDLLAPVTGEYTLVMEINEYYRLYIDNQLVKDRYKQLGESYDSIKINFIGGDLHKIKLEYYEEEWRSNAMLLWKIPYLNKKHIIPSKYLYPLDLVDNVNENTTLSNIEVYPSLTNDFINIKLPENQNYRYSINQLDGRLIQNDTKLTSNKIDVSHLQAGIYFLTLENNGSVYKTKFIKN